MTPAEALVERILHAASRNGHDELARLAYGMARSCLARADRKDTSHIRWFEDPREVSDLRRDFGVLATRLGLDVDLSDLPAVSPAGSAALPAGRACIDAAERIEGTTPRIVLIRACYAHANGHPVEAERDLDRLIQSPMPRRMVQLVQETRQGILLQLGQPEAVIEIGDAMQRHFPNSLVASFNTATAFAWMEDARGVETFAARFRAGGQGIADQAFWEELIRAEAEWFARRLNRDREQIEAAFQLRPQGGEGT